MIWIVLSFRVMVVVVPIGWSGIACFARWWSTWMLLFMANVMAVFRLVRGSVQCFRFGFQRAWGIVVFRFCMVSGS